MCPCFLIFPFLLLLITFSSSFSPSLSSFVRCLGRGLFIAITLSQEMLTVTLVPFFDFLLHTLSLPSLPPLYPHPHPPFPGQKCSLRVFFPILLPSLLSFIFLFLIPHFILFLLHLILTHYYHMAHLTPGLDFAERTVMVSSQDTGLTPLPSLIFLLS